MEGDRFLVDVVCEVGDVTLDLGSQATVRLDEANSYSHRIDHIPFGAVCTVTEQDAVGAFGETSRTGAAQTIPVGATCALTEVGVSHAHEIVIVGDNMSDHGDGAATVVLGTATTTATNTFDAGPAASTDPAADRPEEPVTHRRHGLLAREGESPHGLEHVCTLRPRPLSREPALSAR